MASLSFIPQFLFLLPLPAPLNQEKHLALSIPSQNHQTFFHHGFSPKSSHQIPRAYRFRNVDEFFDEDGIGDCRFDEAVFLFNNRDYHRCHDFLEAIWSRSEEPRRTLIHGILQCAVGFDHLFNQNHRGAMIELGEGLCKLRKMNFRSGPFHQFEQEISTVLDFIYKTQLELAACTDDICLTMDGSQRSYQLLGSFGAGQQLYSVETDHDNVMYIVFCREDSNGLDKPARVKVPTLLATEDHLKACGGDEAAQRDEEEDDYI